MVNRIKEFTVNFFSYNVIQHGRFFFFFPITCDLFFVSLLCFEVSKIGEALVAGGAVQVSAGILQEVVVNYVRNNRSALTRIYASFDDYKRLFVVPEMLIKQLDDKAKGQNLRKSKENVAFLKQYIKGMIAQRIYSLSEYYRIINEVDADFLQAVHVIDHWDQQTGKILK